MNPSLALNAIAGFPSLLWSRLIGWRPLATSARAQQPLTSPPPDTVRPLLSEVLPIWTRHLASVREQTDEGVTALATSLAAINSRFEDAGFRGASQAEAADGAPSGAKFSLLTLCKRELQPVVMTMDRIVNSKASMATAIHELSNATRELHGLATGVRQLAQQTNLLATNAAIEAAHAGAAGRGFAVLAKEIRNLSALSAKTGHEIDERVAQVTAVTKSTVEAAVAAAEDDKIAMELAGRVVNDVLSHVREISADAETMREQGGAIREEVERLMLNLQFQDRVSQIMGVVEQDMSLLHEATAANDELPPTAQWLDALQGRYTMDAQRADHAGGSAQAASGSVDFF
ncbi:MAG: hypothetical protein H7255_16010 [Ramlibacter sp.]|nr:hypothetical protein [Ramlibacter sp.]